MSGKTVVILFTLHTLAVGWKLLWEVSSLCFSSAAENTDIPTDPWWLQRL